MLVAQKRRFVQALDRGVVTHQTTGLHLGQLQLVLQHGAHQMLGTFAHGNIDHGRRNFGQIDIGQSQIECSFKIGHGVDQGAVEVDHQGLDSG